MDNALLNTFLEEQGFAPDSFSPEAEIRKFRLALQRGLKGPDPTGLEMLPAYLHSSGPLKEGVPVLVVDAGGTNLRTALLHFENGRAVIGERFDYPMPGHKKPLTKEEYLAEMCEILRPDADKSDVVGYCFSYAATVRPDHDAALINFCKGVDIRGAEGMLICRELDDALAAAGLPAGKKWALLNDSTAALLGGVLSPDAKGGLIGFILGTGLNICYEEQTAAVKHYSTAGYDAPTILINTESGCYNGFPMTRADRLLHLEDPQPGEHVFEKMVSGAYLGKLVLTLAQLAAMDGLFSPETAGKLLHLSKLETAEIGRLLAHVGKPQAPDDTAQPNQPSTSADETQAPHTSSHSHPEPLLKSLLTTAEDVAVFARIAEAVVDRAALYVSAALTAVLEQSGLGRDAEAPACIMAEGSTFWRFDVYRAKIFACMETLAGKGHGLHYLFTRSEDANLIGAAAAALLNA